MFVVATRNGVFQGRLVGAIGCKVLVPSPAGSVKAFSFLIDCYDNQIDGERAEKNGHQRYWGRALGDAPLPLL